MFVFLILTWLVAATASRLLSQTYQVYNHQKYTPHLLTYISGSEFITTPKFSDRQPPMQYIAHNLHFLLDQD